MRWAVRSRCETALGHGSTIRIKLPLTLAILDGLLLRVGAQTYVIPLVSIVESIRVRPEQVQNVAGCGDVITVRQALPLVRLASLFHVPGGGTESAAGLVVIVEHDGRHWALLVDELLGQQQVVVKSLETNFRKVVGITGATILGDGHAAFDSGYRRHRGDVPRRAAVERGIEANDDLASRSASMTQQAAVAGSNGSPAESSQYLTFVLGAEQYGVEILRVQEIKGYAAITPIPNTPAHIKGVINLRGTVVPVVDLRAKFSLEATEYNKFTVIIVVTLGDKVIGMLVDAVSDVLDIAASEMRPVPDLGGRADTRFISGMASLAERMTVLLDIDRLLGSDEEAALESLS